MKKRLLYYSPQAAEFHVNLECAMLTTSNVDMGSAIDSAIEESWIISDITDIF